MTGTESAVERVQAPGLLRLGAWLAFTGLLATLAYAARLLVREDGRGEGSSDALYRWDAFVGGVVQYTLMAVVLLAISAGLPLRDLLGLRRPASWPAALGLALLVLVATLVAAGLLRPLGDAGEEQGLLPEGWDASRAAPFAANAVLVALAAPLVEELLFRGLGYALLARFGAAVAIATTALLFGAVHGLVIGLPLLVVFGAGLAYLRHRTGSLYPSILLHAVFNGVALIGAVALGGEG